jgi:UDP-glucose 4-epimerase
MNVIITGGFGFLGANVIKQCIDFGFNPIVLERHESKKEILENIDYISIKYNDIQDENIIETIKKYNPQSFIHIAWKGIDGSTRNDEEQVTYNIPFSLKTIGIGSLSEYGKLTKPVNEEQCPVPLSLYAKAKLATCWASSALCQFHNINWSWIRVGSIFGPGDAQHWLIPYVIKSFSEGLAPKLTLSQQIWDYLYVTDAANAILNVVKHQANGIFNLGSGIELTIKEVVELIADKMNSHIKPEFGARPYQLEQIMYMVADITKITKSVGWQPKVSLPIGIDMTLSSLSKNNHHNIKVNEK